jgi:hypothetical protein
LLVITSLISCLNLNTADLTASTSSEFRQFAILDNWSPPSDSHTSVNKSSSIVSMNFLKSCASDLAVGLGVS